MSNNEGKIFYTKESDAYILCTETLHNDKLKGIVILTLNGIQGQKRIDMILEAIIHNPEYNKYYIEIIV